MPERSRQSGIALITAILIAALVTAAAVAMATNQQFGIQRGHNVVVVDRLQLVIRDLEDQASSALSADRELGQTDDRGEIWATEEYVTTRGNLTATGVIEDLQGRLNLTNLSSHFGANTGSSRPATGRQTPASSDPSSADEPGPLEKEGPLPNDEPQFKLTDSSRSGNPDSNDEFTEQFYQDFLLNYQASCQGELWWCAEQARYAFQSQFATSGQTIPARADEPGQAAGAGQDQFPGSADASSGFQTANDPQNIDPQQTGATGSVSGPNGARAIKKNLSEQHLAGLFRALDLDPEPIQAILDWVDEDSETRYPNGAEDEHYTGLSPGYRAANRPFTSPRELLLVRGITPESYVKLEPFITALPQPTKINVNTASTEVLMSLSPLIDRGTAEMLIEARNVQPFQSVDTFVSHPLMYGRSISAEGLSIDSEFFKLSGVAHSDRLESHSVSTLYRNGASVSVARRNRDFFE